MVAPRRAFATFLAFLGLLGCFFGLSCAEPIQPTLEVDPPSTTLITGTGARPGTRVRLTVTRRFSGGAVDDISNHVSIVSSDKAVATVEGREVIAGQSAGTVLIRVSDPSSDATTAATFTVVAPTIQSIDIAPSPALVMAPGQRRQFTARARFNDASERDVTSEVQWSSTNEAAAIVGRSQLDNGLVSAITEGDTSIVATDPLTLIQARTIVFVRGQSPQVISIVVTPNPAIISLGGTTQFVANAILSDGTTRNVTSTAKWSSARADIATISAAGLATPVATGDTTITATVDDPVIVPAPVRGSAAARVQ